MGATDETMVESEDPSPSCCGPHVFTSVLLGVLACVLMTGGVFLAFHRWDPLWLIVSGVGVILVLIGSILHCCRDARRPPGGKGCCLPDHLHNHVVLNGGSLTEQLLPLSNARSVSQLSLNMLPGYFPPMVTTYGIEQHSAVVQNINRIIQQQSPQSPVGKNFILLSLPGNTPQANIQNLVATVYQLDGSVLAESSNPADAPSVNAASPATQNHIPVLKHAEVQTCASWPVPNLAKPTTSAMPSTSNATNERSCTPISTQTDDVAINLMDCLPEPICDIPCNSASTVVDIPPPAVLVDVSQNTTRPEDNRTSLLGIPDSSINTLLEINSLPQPPNIPTSTAVVPLEVLVDVSETVVDGASSSSSSSCAVQSSESGSENNLDNASTITTRTNEVSIACTNNIVPPTSTETSSCATDSASSAPESPSNNSETAVASSSARLDTLEDVFQNDHSENSSLSLVDVDDIDSIGRSSPPPSYEDVALQGEPPAGVFGLAYGTL